MLETTLPPAACTAEHKTATGADTRSCFGRRARDLAAAAALAALSLAGCGGGSGDVPQQTGTPAPIQAPAPPERTLMRMHEAVGVTFGLVSSALLATIDGVIWTDGPCVFDSGALVALVDGAAAGKGTALPYGSHTLAVEYRSCLTDGLAGSSLDGMATAAYSMTTPDDFSARMSASALDAVGWYSRFDLDWVTVEGSADRTSTRNGSAPGATFVPAPGLRLTDKRSTHSLTFGGGSYSDFQPLPEPGLAASRLELFSDLVIVIDGGRYVLKGQLESRYAFDSRVTYAGEIRFERDGALAARLYADDRGALRSEVLAPLPVF
jgi:hypothetical protein